MVNPHGKTYGICKNKCLVEVSPKEDVDTHINDTTNPHSVTKAQVGLGNVDNTSDEDKPISTATQNALNGKADKTYVDDELALKADITYVDTEIAGIDVAPPIATEAEAIEGTDDTKMMTPLKVQHAILNIVAQFHPAEVAPLLPPVVCSELLTMYKNDTTLTETPLINAKNCTSLESVFSGCTNLVTVGYIHCPNVTNMNYMFKGCSSLTTVPLLDTSKVTDMREMFSRCSSLTTVPLIDTSSVTNMKDMFSRCSSLTTVPLIDTSSVTDMFNMFSRCSVLTSVTFQCDDVRPYGDYMFDSTPIASGNGYIFVPDNLVEAYRTASGWSAHASVIYGHSDKENMTSQIQQMTAMNIENKPSEEELRLMMQEFDDEEH